MPYSLLVCIVAAFGPTGDVQTVGFTVWLRIMHWVFLNDFILSLDEDLMMFLYGSREMDIDEGMMNLDEELLLLLSLSAFAVVITQFSCAVLTAMPAVTN